MGGSTRVMGVQLGGKVIGAGLLGCGCGARTGEQQRAHGAQRHRVDPAAEQLAELVRELLVLLDGYQPGQLAPMLWASPRSVDTSP